MSADDEAPGQRSLRETVLRLMRFGAVGVASNVVYFTVLFVLDALSVPVELSGALSYLTSMGVNYVLQRSFTFRTTKSHGQAAWRFVAVHGIAMAVNSALLSLGVRVFGWPLLAAQLMALVVVTAWTYTGLARFVFGETPADDGASGAGAERG